MTLSPADILGTYATTLLLLAAGFGATWGSFLNVCIARIPRGMSVVSPPSHCFSCGARVRALDNIPIVSYFLLRGRCRACGAKFSGRHALVEALTAGLSVLVLWSFVLEAPALPLGVRVARYAVYFTFAAVLVVLTFIDLDTKRLPDVITLPAIVFFFLGGFATGEIVWWERALGAALGYVLVRVISDAYYYTTGREGLGLGDGKLLAMMGALLGWKALPAIVFSASLVGVLVSIPLLLVKRSRERKTANAAVVPAAAEASDQPAPGDATSAATAPKSIRHAEVPFGPFLSASALVYLFLQQHVWGFIENVGTAMVGVLMG